VVLRVQIDLLAGTQSFDGVCVEQYQTVRIGMAPFDAGTGDVVGLRRQAVMLEKLPTRPYDARIVDIDILMKNHVRTQSFSSVHPNCPSRSA